MRVCGIGLALAALAFWSAIAQAQIAFYGQATGANLQYANTSHLFGATFGMYDTKRVGPVAVGADIRAAFLSRGATQLPLTDEALDMGQFGVRVAATPRKLPLIPYAEALVGPAYWRGGLSTTRNDALHWMMQVVGGLDYAIVPRVQWRVVEFSYGRAGAVPGFINPETLSTGIVLILK